MERNGQFETNEGDIDESRRDFLRASAAGIAGAGLLSGAGTPVSASAKGSGDGGTTFLGTTNPAELYSRTDSGDWSQVGESILSGDGSVTDVAEFDGTVIAGTTTETGQGDGTGAVYAFDGDSWDQLGGDLDNEVTTLVTYEGDLYAGTSYGDARLYRYDRDGGWRLVLERTDWDGVGAARVADVGLDGTSESGIVQAPSVSPCRIPRKRQSSKRNATARRRVSFPTRACCSGRSTASPTKRSSRNPEQRRGALENKLDAVHGQLEDGAYRGARQKLRNDVRGAVERWLGTDYETAANEYTRAELLALIDDQTERLETLHSGGGGNGNGGNRRGNGNGSGR